MNLRNYLTTLKILPVLVGMTSVSVLASLPAGAEQLTGGDSAPRIAQAETESSTPELSPAAMKILCERFPLNSRCAGQASGTPDAAPATPADDTTSEQPVTDSPAESTSEDMQEQPVGGAEQPASPTDAPPGTMTPGAVAPEPPVLTPATPSSVTPPSFPAPTGGAEQPMSPTPAAPPEATPPTPGPESEMPTSEPSSQAPAGAAPGADGLKPSAAEPSSSSGQISDAELQQFASAIPQLSQVDKSIQTEVSEVIGKSGLSQEKFQELAKSQSMPGADASASSATPEEKQSFTQAMTQIQSIEKKGQSKQEEIIRTQGLEPQRFQQILAAVRQDPSLKDKVQKMVPAN